MTVHGSSKQSSTSTHTSPSPLYPEGHSPHTYPSSGAATSLQLTPSKHGHPRHPSVSPHTLPLPEKPALHVQLCRPGPSWLHVAFIAQSSSSNWQGRISSHVPSANIYPPSHTQSYAFAPMSVQLPAPHGSPAQSSISKHDSPSPLKPDGHTSHRNPSAGAGTSWHVTPSKHGDPAQPSVSSHSVPLPEKPLWHVQL